VWAKVYIAAADNFAVAVDGYRGEAGRSHVGGAMSMRGRRTVVSVHLILAEPECSNSTLRDNHFGISPRFDVRRSRSDIAACSWPRAGSFGLWVVCCVRRMVFRRGVMVLIVSGAASGGPGITQWCAKRPY